MALLSDGSISQLDDLSNYESIILEVAHTEHINLLTKLELAKQELATELAAFLALNTEQRQGGTGSAGLEARNVAVTPALRQWHTFQSLALVYRDAYNSHFNDRYLGKWKEYERLARWAYSRVCEAGVGMVFDPLAKAAPPVLGSTSGEVRAAMYWVAVSWLNLAGEEGCVSEPAVASLPEGRRPTVGVSDPPASATGWNVYVGPSAEEMLLQNEAPLAVGETWTMPEAGLQPGRRPGNGQTPAYFVTVRRVLQRG